MKVFEYPFTILERHLDVFGHMNHATYLEVFEEARWDMTTALGHGLEKVFETKIGPVILEAKVRYRRELSIRQKVIIQTWWLFVKHKVGQIEQKMVDANGKVYAEASFRAAFFDMEKRKLVSPPAEWAKAFSAITGIAI